MILVRGFDDKSLSRGFVVNSLGDLEGNERGTGFLRIYMQWKVRVRSPPFSTIVDLEQSFSKSPETNTEDEHKVNE